MADLIFASSRDADLRYAIQSEVSDAVFFLEVGPKKFVFLDHREIGIFKLEKGHEDIEAVLLNPLLNKVREDNPDSTPAERDAALALLILEEYASGDTVVRVPRSFPLDIADRLREEGFAISVREPFYQVRAVKSATEIEAIKDTVRRTSAAFARIESILRESEISNDRILWHGEVLTSDILKAEAEIALLREGLADVEGMIISCEAHSAIPHHKGEGPLLPYEPIVCDIFPRDRVSGYFADVTRTYVKGEPSLEIQKMYDAVLLAQTRAIAAVRPGVAGKEVHAAVVEVLQKHGFKNEDGQGFIHGTGHGVGLEVHEAPSLGASSEEVLEAGNVITVEPGLYYEEHGGVRIEDVVLVTENGCENLTEIPKVFQIS